MTDVENISFDVHKKESNTPETPSVRQKETLQTAAEANLQTFSRQKLALLQSEYDPKSCSYCMKPTKGLKTCIGCRTAKYCSRECQSKDWLKKHKKHCKEMIRLKTQIDGTQPEGMSGKGLRAAVCDNPWFLESRLNYSGLCLYQDKLILVGSGVNSLTIVCMCDSLTGKEEKVICRLPHKEFPHGICTLKVGDSQYIAISRSLLENLRMEWRIEFWAFPEVKPKLAYISTMPVVVLFTSLTDIFMWLIP